MNKKNERKCCVCKKIKPIEEFALDPSVSTGRAYVCKACKAIYAKYYYRKNREKYLAYAENKRREKGQLSWEEKRKRRQARYDEVMTQLDVIEHAIKGEV